MSAKALERPLPIGPDTVAGVAVVTIPLADYKALLEASRRCGASHAKAPPPFPHSPIDANPEISAFIDARLGKMRLIDIEMACAAEFGERAPSKSAIHRYHQRRRK